MASLSAAELQRRHELEGAPDPFPSLSDKVVEANGVPRSSNSKLDTDSDTAFPSLSSLAAAKPIAATWGAGSAPRVASPAPARSSASQTVTLPSIDLSQAMLKGAGGKPPTLLEYQKTVASKFRVQISSTQQRTTGQTTFTIKADSDKEIVKARKHLIATLSPTVTLKIEAPNSTLPSIIGPGGATIKAIRDKTNARIDVPRRDEPAADGLTVGDDHDDEPTTTVTVSAAEPLAYEAKALIQDIISSKKAKSTQRIRDVPSHVIPFILPHKTDFLSAATGLGDVSMTLDRTSNTIIASGDREAVKAVVDKLSSTLKDFKTTLTPLKMPLPKQQHRLLTASVIADITQKTRCSVTVPSAEDSSDEITVWGNIKQGADLSSALSTVLEKVNSQHTQEFALPEHSSQSIMTFVTRTSYAKKLQADHPKVAIYFPTRSQIANNSPLSIDLVGERELVDSAVSSISRLVSSVTDGHSFVSIDQLHHRQVQRKAGKRMKQIYETDNVHVFFPDSEDITDSVLLVFDPVVELPADEKAKRLEAIQTELVGYTNDCGELRSESINVDKRWHESVLGKDGTTLNALLGDDDRILSVKFRVVSSEGSGQDVIEVRGVPSDVDRAVKDIKHIVEAAKEGKIEHNYLAEFEIERDFVGRIVGAGGSAVNRLRDTLGVKIDFMDESDDKDKEVVKRKKGGPTVLKAKLKITGRKENVEEAKRRIMKQVDRLADETSEILIIPSQYHSSLIGTNGKYVVRLEEKYLVKITFPRDGGEGEGRTREVIKPNEVLVKGVKKGVANAKAELLEALEFEKESNNTLQFTVPTKAIPRILGKGGSSINEIKDTTDAQIDVDKGTNENSQITLRGTKKSIAAAKAAILAISEVVGDETNEVVKIESKHHRALIGAGGQGLRNLIAKCGGPTDSRSQASLVHFPRPGEKADEIQLRGDKNLVKKIKVELEKQADSLRDRVVLGIAIPAVHHKNLIGRGGQVLNELQDRMGVQVQFPGSRSYASVGDPENSAQLKEGKAADLVKILGPRAACETTLRELEAKIISLDTPKPVQQPSISITISVPRKYHHTIHQQGNFPRQLRTMGVQLEQSGTLSRASVPKPPAVAVEADTKAARIDDETVQSTPARIIGWQIVPNYQDGEEGSDDWILKARDQECLNKGQKHLEQAILHAEQATHVGFLTLPNRNVFPRIVGAKGANVARLRTETAADITVSKDDNLITIIGDEKALEDAKVAILAIANGRGRND